MRYFLLSVSFTLFLFFTPQIVFAASYGAGTYGAGVYGDSTSGGSSTSNNSISVVTSISNTVSAFFCTATAPSSAPNLYEIDVKGSTAQLFFSPAGGPYDSYFVSYGSGENSEGNGVQFAQGQTKGAITYQVDHLSPLTTYTFKVRGGNSCKPGPWSSNLTIKTQAKGAKKVIKFMPKTQVVAAPAKKQSFGSVWNQLFWQPTQAPAPNPKLAAVKGTTSDRALEQQVAQKQQPSLWQNITGFFSNLFHF